MSDPNSQQPKEIRKSILIIKSQPKSLMAVESFLRNRDWRIQSTTNMKDALTFLVSQKPSFVMISVDHPNKKVRGLPKLLQQAFPVFVIVFAESNTTTSYKNLVESGCPYRVNPPATGPAVERAINKIIRDQEVEKENRALAAARAANPDFGKTDSGPAYIQKQGEAGAAYVPKSGEPGAAGKGGSEFISIQGAGPGSFNVTGGKDLLSQLSDVGESGDDDTDLASFLSTAAAEAKKNPAQFMNDDAAPLAAVLSADQLASDDEATMEESGHRRKKKGNGSWVPSEVQDEQGDGGTFEGASSLGGSITQKGAGAGEAKSAMQEGHGSADPHSASQGQNAGELMSSGEMAPGRQGDTSALSTGDHGTDHVLPSFRKNPKTGAPQTRYDESDFEGAGGAEASSVEPPVFDQRKRTNPMNSKEMDAAHGKAKEGDSKHALNDQVHRVSGSKGWQKDDNIIVRGTQKALEDSITVGDGVVKQKVEDSSNVACLIVESAKFSGFLVAALGKNRKIDQKFIDTIKDRLGKFLKDNGEPIKDEQSMALKIKKVDFEDWALEYADFLRKSVHEGEEIAMAFFPFAEAQTQVKDSASSDMGAVKLDELKGDIPVDFNLYVYLPSNQKYVLYTPRGSKFYGNQKDRLDRMGVTHMHVRRTELQDVSKYRAQNYLNSKIEEFQNRKKPSGAGAAA
jgi:hypothetical protein